MINSRELGVYLETVYKTIYPNDIVKGIFDDGNMGMTAIAMSINEGLNKHAAAMQSIGIAIDKVAEKMPHSKYNGSTAFDDFVEQCIVKAEEIVREKADELKRKVETLERVPLSIIEKEDGFWLIFKSKSGLSAMLSVDKLYNTDDDAHCKRDGSIINKAIDEVCREIATKNRGKV